MHRLFSNESSNLRFYFVVVETEALQWECWGHTKGSGQMQRSIWTYMKQSRTPSGVRGPALRIPCFLLKLANFTRGRKRDGADRVHMYLKKS